MRDKVQEALESGFSQAEIYNYLKKHPEHGKKIAIAEEEGYNPKEIIEHLSPKKEKTQTKEPRTKAALKGVTEGLFDLLEFGAKYNPFGALEGIIRGREKTPYITEKVIEPLKEKLLQKMEEKAPTEGYESYQKAGKRYGAMAPFGPVIAVPMSIAGQLAEEAGLGPVGQTVAEIGAGGIGALKDLPGALAKKGVTRPSGLKLPQVVAKEGKEFGALTKPLITKGRKVSVEKGLTEQAEKLIEKIKKEKLPISEEIEKGIDVAARHEKNFDQIEKMASKIKRKYETKGISDYLESVENKIREAPVPTEDETKVLKLIDKYKKQFHTDEGGTRFYNTKELVKQFRNINKDTKKLYQTKFVHGEQKDIRNFYEGLKDSIENTFEGRAPKEFTKSFKETNADYSQTKRLKKFEEIMESISPNNELDTKKFTQFISNPKKANILKHQIGEEGFSRLKSISKDLELAQRNMDKLKTLGLRSLISPSNVGFAVLKLLKVPHIGAVKLGKTAFDMARGFMLTSPEGYRATTNFLRAVRSNNVKSIKAEMLKMMNEIDKYQSTKNKKSPQPSQ